MHAIRATPAPASLKLLEPKALTIPTASEVSFGVDALRWEPDYSRHFTSIDGRSSWAAAAAEWRRRIEAEELVDVNVALYRSRRRWRIRATDGALVRGDDSLPLGWQFGAWAQFCALFTRNVGPHTPRSLAHSAGWLTPETRAVVFDEIIGRSVREESTDATVLLRTHLTVLFPPRREGEPQPAPVPVRAVRAVLSGRHSGVHFDDLAVAKALDGVLRPELPAQVSRGTNETHGVAVLDGAEEHGAQATLHWRNSETGDASLAFSGGCRITALDTVVVMRRAVDVQADVTDLSEEERRTYERSVTIAAVQGRSRRAHTLPRAGRTEAERAEIALARITLSIEAATVGARAMVADWALAMKSFPEGWDKDRTVLRDEVVEVVLDAVTERTRAGLDTKEARKAFGDLLTSEERLAGLPFMSAAYVAGVFSLLAHSCTDAKRSMEYREAAAEWVQRRW